MYPDARGTSTHGRYEVLPGYAAMQEAATLIARLCSPRRKARASRGRPAAVSVTAQRSDSLVHDEQVGGDVALRVAGRVGSVDVEAVGPLAIAAETRLVEDAAVDVTGGVMEQHRAAAS